jgi:hypothetical protein
MKPHHALSNAQYEAVKRLMVAVVDTLNRQRRKGEISIELTFALIELDEALQVHPCD